MHEAADFALVFLHNPHDVLGEIFGVIRHETKAEFAFDGRGLIEKIGKIRTVRQIVAVRIDVLTEQRDFFIPLLYKRFDFG